MAMGAMRVALREEPIGRWAIELPMTRRLPAQPDQWAATPGRRGRLKPFPADRPVARIGW
jgi:hypothetical protein